MTFVKMSHLNHPSATCIPNLSTAFSLLHRVSTCCVYYPETAQHGSSSFWRGPKPEPGVPGRSHNLSLPTSFPSLHPRWLLSHPAAYTRRCSAALRLCLASPSGHRRLENACGPGKTTPKSPPSRSALCRVLRTGNRPSQSPLLCTHYLLLSL